MSKKILKTRIDDLKRNFLVKTDLYKVNVKYTPSEFFDRSNMKTRKLTKKELELWIAHFFSDGKLKKKEIEEERVFAKQYLQLLEFTYNDKTEKYIVSLDINVSNYVLNPKKEYFNFYQGLYKITDNNELKNVLFNENMIEVEETKNALEKIEKYKPNEINLVKTIKVLNEVSNHNYFEPIKKISISESCKTNKISRATFYRVCEYLQRITNLEIEK